MLSTVYSLLLRTPLGRRQRCWNEPRWRRRLSGHSRLYESLVRNNWVERPGYFCPPRVRWAPRFRISSARFLAAMKKISTALHMMARSLALRPCSKTPPDWSSSASPLLVCRRSLSNPPPSTAYDSVRRRRVFRRPFCRAFFKQALRPSCAGLGTAFWTEEIKDVALWMEVHKAEKPPSTMTFDPVMNREASAIR